MPSTSSSATQPKPIDLDAKIEQLLRHDAGELDSYIAIVERDIAVSGTLAKMHCNVLQLDGNGTPRMKDLARWLAFHVIDYAIPRQEILDALKFDTDHNTTRRMADLKAKAARLFTKIKKTGEGGEILLYVLAQKHLGLPQLFCKMPHKTSTQVHLHGIDGIHVGVDKSNGRLLLFGVSPNFTKQ